MLREHWSLLGMPERECDCLGLEFGHSRKRREDFLRRFIDAKSESDTKLEDYDPSEDLCCEHCDKWFHPEDLRETVDDNVCCENCCEELESTNA